MSTALEPLDAIVTRAAETLELLDARGELVRLDSLSIIDLAMEIETASGIRMPKSALTSEVFRSRADVVNLLASLSAETKA